MDQKTILEIIQSKGTINHLVLAKTLNATRPEINPILDSLEKQNLIKSSKPNGRKYYSSIGSGIKLKSKLVKKSIKDQAYLDSIKVDLNSILVKVKGFVYHDCKSTLKCCSTNPPTGVCCSYYLYIFFISQSFLKLSTTLQGRSSLNTDFNIPSTKSFRKKPLMDPWSSQAFDYWNSKPELQTHRRYNKHYHQCIEVLNRIFDGSEFINDQSVKEIYFRRKFTLEEFKKAVDNYILAVTDNNFEPRDKTKIAARARKMRLHNWLHNPYSPYETSLFIKYFEGPKRIQKVKLVPKVELKNNLHKKAYKYFLEFYIKENFGGNIDEISTHTLDNIKLGIVKLYDYFSYLYEPNVRGIWSDERAELLWEFCQENLKYFSPKNMQDSWFWKSFHRFMVDKGIADEDEF